MRHIQKLLTLVIVVCVAAPGLAHAQAAGDPTIWFGGSLGLSPLGTVKGQINLPPVGVFNTSQDSATGFQINALIDVRVAPFLSIGFAPGLLLNVKPSNGNDSGSMIDLPLRVTLGAPVAPKVRLYGFASPGYSILFPPSGNDNAGHPSGFMIGFGGGVGYRVAPKIAVTGELGYQFRFLSSTVNGLDASADVDYLTIALGVVAAIN